RPLADRFGPVPGEEQLGDLAHSEPTGVRNGCEHPDEVESVVRPDLGYPGRVPDEAVRDQGDPLVLPRDEDMTLARQDRRDELIELVLEKGLVERQGGPGGEGAGRGGGGAGR